MIVSAGPSLRKNKHLLNDAARQGGASSPCRRRFSRCWRWASSRSSSRRWIITTSARDSSRSCRATLQTELVAEPKATDAIFDLHPGPALAARQRFRRNAAARDEAEQERELPSGATVAHLAYYLAEHLGCDPIIFVGQDLGFSEACATRRARATKTSGGRSCRGSARVEMKQWEQIVRDRHILRRTAISRAGRCTPKSGSSPTSSSSSAISPRASARIIDATEGGVLKRGATAMTFAEAIEQFCTGADRIRPPPHRGLNCATAGRMRCDAFGSALDEATRDRADQPRNAAAARRDSRSSGRSGPRESRDLADRSAAGQDERAARAAIG